MFETAVCDCAQKLTLEQEVLESSGVNTDITTLDFGVAFHVCVAFLRSAIGSGSRRLGLFEFFVRVVDEILLGRHYEDGFVFVLEW